MRGSMSSMPGSRPLPESVDAVVQAGDARWLDLGEVILRRVRVPGGPGREGREHVYRGPVDEPLGGEVHSVPAGRAAYRADPAHRARREHPGPARDRVVRGIGEGREAVA